MNKLLLAIASICLASPALADLQMTIRDGDGRVSTISSDGQRSRIQESSDSSYVIIDYAAGEMLMVDPKRNEVLQTGLGKGGAAVAGSGGVEIGLKKKGGGPVIAGYSTSKYAFTANGTACGTIYASPKLLRNSAVRTLFESMRSLQAQSRQMMQGMSGILPLCQQANLFLIDSLESIGAPMRVLDQNGQLESEVVQVRTDVNIPGSRYRAPAGMSVVSMEEKMNQMQGQTQELMQQVPEMGEILQQLEQGGQQIPDDAMEQLKKLQQQLKQLKQ